MHETASHGAVETRSGNAVMSSRRSSTRSPIPSASNSARAVDSMLGARSTAVARTSGRRRRTALNARPEPTPRSSRRPPGGSSASSARAHKSYTAHMPGLDAPPVWNCATDSGSSTTIGSGMRSRPGGCDRSRKTIPGIRHSGRILFTLNLSSGPHDRFLVRLWRQSGTRRSVANDY